MQTQGKTINFEGQNFYVGIDVHLKTWKVTILGEQYEHKMYSTTPSPKKVSDYLNKNFRGGKFYAVYEAGFCGFSAQREFERLGIDCKVIHPADLPNNHKQRQQKTDVHDSRSLAKYLRGSMLEGIYIPDEELERDRILIRQRHTLTKDLARYKNRVKSVLHFLGIEIPKHISSSQSRHWSAPYTKWLKEICKEQDSFSKALLNYVEQAEHLRSSLKVVTKQIRELSRSDRYKKGIEILISIPGIGLITGMMILTEIADIRRFKRLDDLCSYVGLIPRMNCSGEKVSTGKLVKRGRSLIKIMLIEASWIALRSDPALMLTFNELIKRMNKNKAIIRIARKLLNRIRHLLINEVKYEKGIVC